MPSISDIRGAQWGHVAACNNPVDAAPARMRVAQHLRAPEWVDPRCCRFHVLVPEDEPSRAVADQRFYSGSKAHGGSVDVRTDAYSVDVVV